MKAMSLIKHLFELQRYKESQCCFCGAKVTQVDQVIKHQILKRFPEFGIVLSEIKRNRGTDDVCNEHLRVLVKLFFKKRNKQVVFKLREAKKFAAKLRYRRIAELVRRDMYERLNQASGRKKSRDTKIETVEDFVRAVDNSDLKLPNISVEDFVQATKQPVERRKPCWWNPPINCCYKDSCSKADICGAAIDEFFKLPRKKPEPVMTHEFYWEPIPCEKNCPDCSVDCPYAGRRLRVRKVPSKKKWRRVDKKAIQHRWIFDPDQRLIDDDWIVEETDAGGPPRD